MATVALSGIITPTNVVTATSTTTLTNKTLTGAVMNGTLGATTPSTVVATTVQASTTIGVGGATPSASGSGISFPATQSASTNANTLDDYEEGTWTPVITASVVVSGTFGGNFNYTKCGSMVTMVIAQTSGTLTWSAGGKVFDSSGSPFVPLTTVPIVFTDTSPYAGGTGHVDTSGRIYSGSAGTAITTLRISSTYLTS
jgi:hypothetical protein